MTGNYGMGKSSALAEFKRLGAATLDSDRVVAGILRDRTVVARIRRILGPDVVDARGRLLKLKVAAKVFSSLELRRGLEDIVHPLVMRKVEAFVRKESKLRPIVVVEVPLLFEGGYEARFDKTVTVHTTRRTAIARLRAAGISEKDAVARLNTQLSITSKKRLSDYRISNEGTSLQLRSRVQRVFHSLVKQGQRRRA